MKKIALIPALYIAILLSGCTAMQNIVQTPKPETVNQAFLLSYALVNSSYQNLIAVLRTPTLNVSKSRAQEVKNGIDKVKQSLDASYAAFQLREAFDGTIFDTTRQRLEAIRASLALLSGEEPIGVSQ